ncbi:MAG: dephospho-CoA kinase [Desulfovibrio sp.]|nr:dephospho-CoA kinase [Desulfovibrio sp.]
MPTTHTFVAEKIQRERLDRYLARMLPSYSRTFLQEKITEGLVRVDGSPQTHPDTLITSGQSLAIDIPAPQAHLMAEEGDIDIVYCDTDLCIVNKPPHLTVHPCPSNPSHTLLQRLLTRFPSLACMEGERPGIVHRIDKDTSGLLLVALREEIQKALSEQFANRCVKKHYLALVAGVPEPEGLCTAPIGRHPSIKTKMAVCALSHAGKPATTRWKRLWVAKNQSCSLLSVSIETGRTHQIRVHMSHLGYPLLGDAVYAPKDIAECAPRQMLHAHSLSFTHPTTKHPLHFQVPPPEDFCATALAMAKECQRVVITGNPGSGKSTVTQAFQAQGIPCFSADAFISTLYVPNGTVALWLKHMGRDELLDAKGAINRTALFTLFHQDPVWKRDLETLLHTSVREQVTTFFATQADMAVAEIPLWFECAWPSMPSVTTVCVTCPQHIRFERLATSRNWSYEKAATIESWQWDEKAKANASDIVIDNSASMAHLVNEIHKLQHILRKRAEEQNAKEQDILRRHMGYPTTSQ